MISVCSQICENIFLINDLHGRAQTTMGKIIPGQVGGSALYRSPRILVGVCEVLCIVKLSMVSYLEEWELLGTE